MKIDVKRDRILRSIGHAFNDNPKIKGTHVLTFYEIVKHLLNANLDLPIWIYFKGSRFYLSNKKMDTDDYYLKVDVEAAELLEIDPVQCKEFWENIDEINEIRNYLTKLELYEYKLQEFINNYDDSQDFEDVSLLECYIVSLIQAYCFPYKACKERVREDVEVCSSIVKRFCRSNKKFYRKYFSGN